MGNFLPTTLLLLFALLCYKCHYSWVRQGLPSQRILRLCYSGDGHLKKQPFVAMWKWRVVFAKGVDASASPTKVVVRRNSTYVNVYNGRPAHIPR